MLKTKQGKSTSRSLKKNEAAWNAVISDTEQIVSRFGKLIDGLKTSIKSLEEMRDDGVQFPENRRGRPPRGY